MSITARSTPNIALIKYWGNRNNDLRLPAADSLSMTLNSPYVDVTVEHAEVLRVHSTSKQLTSKDIERFAKHLELMKMYLVVDSIPNSLNIQIDSHIPSGIGLASSAAVFSAIAKAVAGLIDQNLTDEQVSILARLGSGSASRSILGGFVAMKNVSEGMDGAVAEQIADEKHWNLHDIVIIPSGDEKKVGSTEGHAGAWTSPHFATRLEAIQKYRQQECIDAILNKDFEKLQHISEEDALDMHHCMETQNPALKYLSEDTHHILAQVRELREREHVPVLFTMDAGPTVHLICTDEAKDTISGFAHSQKNCKVFEASVGPGAHCI